MARIVKHCSWVAVAVFLALSFTTSAQAGPAGVGLILGDTVGVSFKYYFDKYGAFDLALGSAVGYRVYPGVSLHGDLMWTDLVTPVEAGRWLYHLGGGLGLASGRDLRSGEADLRFTAGMEYFFERSQFAVFGELVPCLVFSSLPFSLHAAIGGRFYF